MNIVSRGSYRLGHASSRSESLRNRCLTHVVQRSVPCSHARRLEVSAWGARPAVEPAPTHCYDISHRSHTRPGGPTDVSSTLVRAVPCDCTGDCWTCAGSSVDRASVFGSDFARTQTHEMVRKRPELRPRRPSTFAQVAVNPPALLSTLLSKSRTNRQRFLQWRRSRAPKADLVGRARLATSRRMSVEPSSAAALRERH